MSDHIVSKKLYYAIFLALMVLTFATVAVAKVDLGPFNTIVAMAIAVTKAVLVILFFMHVRYSSTLTKLVVGSGFVFVALLIAFVLADVGSRGWIK
jgi:cytochrome c oxidase subunit 4